MTNNLKSSKNLILDKKKKLVLLKVTVKCLDSTLDKCYYLLTISSSTKALPTFPSSFKLKQIIWLIIVSFFMSECVFVCVMTKCHTLISKIDS